MMDVVERLHPVVVQSDHPVFAFGRRELDHQSLVLGQVEVALVPFDLRILELVGLGELGFIGEDVRPPRLTGRPLGADLSNTLDVEAGVNQ